MRKWLLAVFATACVGFVGVIGLVEMASYRQHWFNRAKFDRIEVGMTEPEVRALMDPWPVSHRGRARDAQGHDVIRALYWEDTRNEFAVEFSAGDGKVVRKEMREPPPKCSVLDLLRDWLGL